jgi:hypothetical protein
MKPLNVAAYGMDAMYSNLAVNLQAIQTAGWNSIILGMLHPHLSGDVWYNDTQILSNGNYIGRPDWPSLLQKLTQGPGAGIRLAATVGGAPPWVDDFSNIQTIYQKNNSSFAGTVLQKNFQELFKKLPTIRLIDMDVEETYDEDSFIAFCQMLIQIGYGITFCPYEKPFNNKTFWTGSLKTLNQSNPGAVKWWNLQCYAGGARNKPQDWADAISGAIPGFDTTGFILASDWSRFLAKPDANPRSWSWGGDCPPDMQKKMEPFGKQACVGGAFIWNIDQILGYANDQKQKPDPAPCGNVGMRDYVAAITKGLG